MGDSLQQSKQIRPFPWITAMAWSSWQTGPFHCKRKGNLWWYGLQKISDWSFAKTSVVQSMFWMWTTFESNLAVLLLEVLGGKTDFK